MVYKVRPSVAFLTAWEAQAGRMIEDGLPSFHVVPQSLHRQLSVQGRQLLKKGGDGGMGWGGRVGSRGGGGI
jgi:hypothetical protein